MLKVRKIMLLLVLVCSFCLTGCSFGAAGNSWLVGVSEPDSLDGRVGDMYLNTSNFDLYQLTSDGWSLLGNISGKDGEDGSSGITPVVEINDKGYWFINGKDTGIKAFAQNGKNGVNGIDGSSGLNGVAGLPGKDGSDGKNGIDGVDGVSPTVEISSDGYWVINGIQTSVKALAEESASFYIGYDGYVWNGLEKTAYRMADDSLSEGVIENTIGIEGTMSKYFDGDYVDLSSNTIALMSYYMPNAKLTKYSGVTVNNISVYAEEAGKLSIGTAKVTDIVNARLNGGSYTANTKSYDVVKGLNTIALNLDVNDDETVVLGGNGSVGLYYATGINVDDEQGVFTVVNSKSNSDVVSKTNEVEDKLSIQVEVNLINGATAVFPDITTRYPNGSKFTAVTLTGAPYAYKDQNLYGGKTITKIGVPVSSVTDVDNAYITVYKAKKASSGWRSGQAIKIQFPNTIKPGEWAYADCEIDVAVDEMIAFGANSGDTVVWGYSKEKTYAEYGFTSNSGSDGSASILFDVYTGNKFVLDDHIASLKEKEAQAS